MKTIKLNKEQLKKLVTETAGRGSTYSDVSYLRDADDLRTVITKVLVGYGMMSLYFGNSFTLHLDEQGIDDLIDMLTKGRRALVGSKEVSDRIE